jgi:hypothetical protein
MMWLVSGKQIQAMISRSPEINIRPFEARRSEEPPQSASSLQTKRNQGKNPPIVG